jgi:hypothetical protein
VGVVGWRGEVVGFAREAGGLAMVLTLARFLLRRAAILSLLAALTANSFAKRLFFIVSSWVCLASRSIPLQLYRSGNFVVVCPGRGVPKHEVVVGMSKGVVVVVYLAHNHRIKTRGFDMCTVTEMTIELAV